MKQPVISESVFLAESAVVKGNVTIDEDCSIWHNVTIRANREQIVIGKGSNIQDNSVVHVDDEFPVSIGSHVTVGHGAILHGCCISDNSLIGMGAIILNGTKIGKNCIVGAGALITQNTIIKDNSLVIGNPAKIIRSVTPEEAAGNMRNALLYINEAKLERTL